MNLFKFQQDTKTWIQTNDDTNSYGVGMVHPFLLKTSILINFFILSFQQGTKTWQIIQADNGTKIGVRKLRLFQLKTSILINSFLKYQQDTKTSMIAIGRHATIG